MMTLMSRSAAETAACGRFGPFKPESEKAIRSVKVESNPVIEGMKKAWKRCGRPKHSEWQDYYPSVLKKIRNHEYSAKDIEAFSFMLAEFENEEKFAFKAGVFLSALMNNSNETEFVIHATNFSEPIEMIGINNTKNITVEGNARNNVGHCMESGTITVMGDVGYHFCYHMRGGIATVEGDAGDLVGYSMEGGVSIVKGDAGDEVGLSMKGGSITVEGDAGYRIGIWMEGGEIRINGSIGSISENFKGGRIFHKGKLIAGK